MNSEEQTLIDGLFSRLQQAETDSAPRDAQAEARIKEHLTRQPAAGYFMTQAILVQEAAIKSLDEQNKQLTHKSSNCRLNCSGQGADSGAGAKQWRLSVEHLWWQRPRPQPAPSQRTGLHRRLA
jgi:hypothetical protein